MHSPLLFSSLLRCMAPLTMYYSFRLSCSRKRSRAFFQRVFQDELLFQFWTCAPLPAYCLVRLRRACTYASSSPPPPCCAGGAGILGEAGSLWGIFIFSRSLFSLSHSDSSFSSPAQSSSCGWSQRRLLGWRRQSDGRGDVK